MNYIEKFCRKHPNFGVASITIGKAPGSMAAADIPIDYNEVVSISADNISVGV